MEKIKLNNQIVSMRKFVKQAKVHVINKLVKQIKLLQNRKGKEIHIQKAKRKADRFLEAVALVKKIKPDDVSKLALSKAKDWKNVLQQKNSTLHDRCIAMIASYEAVQKEVEAFYIANKELVLKISDYITQWEEKNKLSKDSTKIKKMSPIKKLSKSNQETDLTDESYSSNKKNKLKTIVKIQPESDDDKNCTVFKVPRNCEKTEGIKAELSENVGDEEEFSSIKKINHKNSTGVSEEIQDLYCEKNHSLKTEELDDDEEESKSDGNYEEEEINDNFFNNNNKGDKDSSDEESNINEAYKSVSQSDLLVKMNNNAKNKLKAITLLNLNDLEGLDEIPVGSSFENDTSDEKERSEDEINENKSIDPFFLGQNKVEFNPKELDDSSNDRDVNIRTEDSAQSFKHKIQTGKRKFFQQKDNQFRPKKFQKSPYNHTNVSKRFRKEENNEMTFKKDNFVSNNYHKKFQEKNSHKNGRDFKLKNKSFSPRYTYDKKQCRNISKGYERKDDNISLKHKMPFKKDNANEPLHPSWQAKKKQKELLSTSFQGKRTVFND